jgi:threonine synthase
MPATALRCRICETEFPLDPVGVCSRCFGPLEPVYAPDRAVTRAEIEAGPSNIWR